MLPSAQLKIWKKNPKTSSHDNDTCHILFVFTQLSKRNRNLYCSSGKTSIVWKMALLGFPWFFIYMFCSFHSLSLLFSSLFCLFHSATCKPTKLFFSPKKIIAECLQYILKCNRDKQHKTLRLSSCKQWKHKWRGTQSLWRQECCWEQKGRVRIKLPLTPAEMEK